MNAANEELAEEVYAVLVDECGASSLSDSLRDFLYHWPDCREYRFQGKLGFGGKVWWNPSRSRPSVYVTCYPENETPERRQMMERANARLAEIASAELLEKKPQ